MAYSVRKTQPTPKPERIKPSITNGQRQDPLHDERSHVATAYPAPDLISYSGGAEGNAKWPVGRKSAKECRHCYRTQFPFSVPVYRKWRVMHATPSARDNELAPPYNAAWKEVFSATRGAGKRCLVQWGRASNMRRESPCWPQDELMRCDRTKQLSSRILISG